MGPSESGSSEAGRPAAGRLEAGSVMPLLALALVAVMVAGLLLGALLGRASDRARAQNAADAAALAGAVEGVDGAQDLAGRNGADLVLFRTENGVVQVVVSYRGVQASARAEQQVVRLRGGCPSLGCSGQ